MDLFDLQQVARPPGVPTHLQLSNACEARPARKVKFSRDLQKDFAAADVDGDGMLTRTEAAEMPIVSDFFDEMDGNADGQVTQDEIREHARTHGPIRVIKGRGPGTAR
jgi:hypothetical protein